MPRSEDVEAIRDAVNAWERQRRTLSGEFTTDSLRKFTESMNTHVRSLIRSTGLITPEQMGALAELATQAATTLTPGAKLFVDGHDRSDTM